MSRLARYETVRRNRPTTAGVVVVWSAEIEGSAFPAIEILVLSVKENLLPSLSLGLKQAVGRQRTWTRQSELVLQAVGFETAGAESSGRQGSPCRPP